MVLAGRVIIRHAGQVVADHALCRGRRQRIVDRMHFVGVAGFEGPVRAERIEITLGHLVAATRRVRSGGRRGLVMTTLDHDLLIAILDRLKLTAIRDQLDTLLDEAARSKMTLREALAFLASSEIARRDERRISMSSKIAQFPFVRELDGFDFDAQPSVCFSQTYS